MPDLGPSELLIVLYSALGLLLPLAVLYLVIRQAVLSALRKFYRELDETSHKSKAKATMMEGSGL